LQAEICEGLNPMKKYALLFLLSGSLCQAAAPAAKTATEVKADLATIAALTPSGYEVAMLYQVTPESTDDQIAELAASYNFADFDGDGIKDLAVAFEQVPTYETGTYSDGTTYQRIVHGHRQLAIFAGQNDGRYVLAAMNDSILAQGDEGGAYDPFSGLQVTNLGSLQVLQESGRGMYHSSSAVKIQYRSENGVAGFYRVGLTLDSDDRFGNSHITTDTNYLNGVQVTTTTLYTRDNSKIKSVHTSRKNLGRKALVLLPSVPSPW
jgi:hypothetical protein